MGRRKKVDISDLLRELENCWEDVAIFGINMPMKDKREILADIRRAIKQLEESE